MTEKVTSNIVVVGARGSVWTTAASAPLSFGLYLRAFAPLRDKQKLRNKPIFKFLTNSQTRRCEKPLT
jgi:hypothetical protein